MHKFYILKQTFKIALKSILADKLRTFLTCLGIIIGTASLICMMTILDLRVQDVALEDEISGKNNVVIDLYYDVMSVSQLERFRDIKGVAGLSPMIQLYDLISVEVIDRLCKETDVYGVSDEFFEYSKGITFVCGEQFGAEDIKNESYVCIINENMKNTYAPNTDVVGKYVYAMGMPFKIVGVCKVLAQGSDEMVMYFPNTTMMEISGQSINKFIIFPKDSSVAPSVHFEADKLIEGTIHKKKYEGYYDSFSIEEEEEGASSAESTLIIQISVAVIAMLIGGIGIMNMMLVMVSERTAEIGLRKAMGATPERIQLQFVLESFMLSLVGGVVGAVTGFALSLGYCIYVGKSLWVNIPSIIVGLVFSMMVGVFFGYSPAKVASELNPIDALKEE